MRYDDERDTVCPKCMAKAGTHCVDRFDDGGTVHLMHSHDERWQTWLPPGSIFTANGIPKEIAKELANQYVFAGRHDDMLDAILKRLEQEGRGQNGDAKRDV